MSKGQPLSVRLHEGEAEDAWHAPCIVVASSLMLAQAGCLFDAAL